VIAVHVIDNQPIRTGDLLATIDPEPFQLVVAQKVAEINEAKAQLASDQDAIAAANDAVSSATSATEFARVTQVRTASLARSDDVSRQSLDQANDTLRRADDALAIAQTAVARAKSQAAMHQA